MFRPHWILVYVELARPATCCSRTYLTSHLWTSAFDCLWCRDERQTIQQAVVLLTVVSVRFCLQERKWLVQNIRGFVQKALLRG